MPVSLARRMPDGFLGMTSQHFVVLYAATPKYNLRVRTRIVPLLRPGLVDAEDGRSVMGATMKWALDGYWMEEVRVAMRRGDS